MKVKLVYGRSGTGKSEYIYNDIKNKLDENKDKIFVIVPEQSNLSAERKLFEITKRKSLINVEVLTLSRMAKRVLNEVGGDINHLSKSGKNMLIYDLITSEKNKLNFLGKSDKNIDSVNRMFTELKKHNVSIEDLKNANLDDEYTKLKLKDIILLYEKYEEKLENNVIDENDLLNILLKKFDKTNMFDNSIIYIDEFLGFTPQEYMVYEKLLSVSSEITVCVATDNLQIDKNKENDIFYFNKKFARKILEISKGLNAQIEEVLLDKTYRFKNTELEFLEKNFENSRAKYNKENVENISLFLANNPYTELEFVAQNIHKLVKKSGYKYNEIGIIAENTEEYAYDAKSIFRKYDIPLFVDEKKELNQNILVKFITSMLDIFSKNWSYEAVFNYIKSGLLNISEDDIFLLENYCIKWGIKGSKWYNRKFDYENVNDVQDKLEILRNQIVSLLMEFKKKVSENRTVTEITKCIYNFLIDNKIIELLDNDLKKYNDIEISDEYNTSYKILMSVFDEMCLIFKDEKISFEKYKELFQVGLNSSELGKIPATQDQVTLGDTERTRSNKIRVLFVIGANDGSFPSVNKAEGFLNDSDRLLLENAGIELAKNSIDSLYEEQFNIYRTLLASSEKLYITYSSSDKSGKSIRPSTLIKKIKRMFPNIKEESDVIEKNHNITNENATFEEVLNVYRDYLDGKDMPQEFESLLRYFYKKDKNKFEKAISGIYYTNKAQNINKDNIEKLYGNTLNTSISRLENYRRCPFSFHLTYGLKLKEKDELKIEAVDTGSFMHEVIDGFFRILDEENLNLKEIDLDKIKEIVERIVTEMLLSSRYYIFSSSAKFKLQTRRLKKVVTQALEYIVYSLKYSDFSVLGHEIEFGNKSDYKPIKLEIENKKIEIVGKIDRVDTAKLSDTQYVRIIDYKSSMKDLDMNQVMSGLQIQLITYLDAISEQTNFEPSGILYLGLIDNIVKSDKDLSLEEIENRIRKNFKMKGLILADVSVVKMMDNKLQTGASDIIPAYITKDGEISDRKSSTIKKDDFQNLTQKVKKIIKEISLEILNGKIDIKPYNYKKKTGCDYCKYKTICSFNTNIKDNEYWYLPNKEKELILEELRNDNLKSEEV